jgi:hypothetical protein
MATTHASAPQALTGTKRARHDCWASIVDVHSALEAPQYPSFSAWAAGVVDALFKLRGAFGEHMLVTEGVGGLYEDVMERAPRLSNRIVELRADFELILDKLQSDLVALADPGAAATTVKAAVAGTLETIADHRKKEADLIYEAYVVDIGAED